MVDYVRRTLRHAPWVCLCHCLLLVAAVQASPGRCPSSRAHLDVSDVSILWPVPSDPAAVAALLTAATPLPNAGGPLWPASAFRDLIAHAQAVGITTAAGNEVKIGLGGTRKEFDQAATWKVVGIRVDPAAPGVSPELIAHFGERPQLRLIMQPVTVSDGKVTVHDFAAHVVFSFSTPEDAANPQGRAVPDRKEFCAILDDLQAIKEELRGAGVLTDGPLSVHPGFAAASFNLSARLGEFLGRHLEPSKLRAVAIMGLPASQPEPWLFISMAVGADGQLSEPPIPSLPGTIGAGKRGARQMLSFIGGAAVVPPPENSQLGAAKGVSTALLFADGSAQRLNDPVFKGEDDPRLSDVPDIVANPRIAHFFNTDCVSCHSESARRADLSIGPSKPRWHYVPPAGISGVEPRLLPVAGGSRASWNVHNFGWFPDFFEGGKTAPTVSMRTANETADAVDFINREYLGR